MEDADNIVHRIPEDRDAGIARLGKESGQLLRRSGILGGHHIYPWGKDLVHIHIVELNSGANKLTFVAVQTALTLRFADHGDKLFPGDAAVLTVSEDLAEEAFPLGEDEIDRPENGHEHT